MAVITSGHRALQYRIRAPAVAEAAVRQLRAHGLRYRLATLPGEHQAATRRAGHHSPAQFLIHHTASLTISSVRSKLVRPDANACTPRAAAQGTSQPHPHHRHRRSWPRRLPSLTERYRCVHLEAGRRVPSDQPEEPPTVRICLQDVGEDRFLISPVSRGRPRALWRVTAVPVHS